ncbi:Do family serine endopeptidase [Rhizobium leguminosarum]|uniref:Do family serine endopeptidase n=1 Tax=Rhizobium TaxID=379 RepID=UPI001C8FABF6|nr:Do family serine endopeptidase [Rhizobium leguminosarum]MBY2913205.1 Do family serine endopeptidase [Rhizobium leguminosarum]MBY2938355.1 Do family serine endopeptidase [Rhizobium leguminosarum]MBY2974311.1 Do family serine endopeptidase [Rhizobium leguminosarum]MBY2981711.1 Do family serine endopeptidase [Rhizobium leguminosarum]MBY2997725.1 Do family serine endopeptidase [Rhizobium leguminosarum]
MAPTIRSPFRRTLALMASAAILAHAGMNGVVYAQTAPETTAPGLAAPAPATPEMAAPAPTPPAPAAPETAAPTSAAPQQTAPIQVAVPNNGPASVADLAEGLLDAVVNISTSQNVKDDEGAGPAPRAPDGSPFQEFFNDFFNKQQGNKGGNHNVSSLGSGFVIDPAGYIVTNNHVIEGADDIEINFANGSKLKAKLIGTDTKTDLSVLKVEPKTPLKSVKFGDSSTMRIGDWVMAIGNPFGFGGSVTVGIISGRGRNINAGPYDNFIQTDAAINKGNSGGPLFNMKGEVIGINTAIISPSGGSIGIGFSVPSELASGVVDQLREYGETRRGWLGVRIQPVTDDIADSLGLDTAKGALVAGVIKGGPVDDGSIKAGDVILKFDGKTVSEMRDLPRVVAESTVGKEVDVVVLRDGKEQTVKVKLGRLEDSDQAAASDDAAPDGSQSDGGVITPDPGENNDMDQPDSGDQAKPAPDSPDQHKGQVSPDAATPKNVLGLSLSLLSAETRKAFGIAESVDGVVVTEVTPGSASAEKGLKPGDVIVEVAQEFMKSPDAVAAKVQALKQEGRRNAQLMVASANGDLRFVAVPME